MNINILTRIAIKELRYLMFSPIGWVVLAAFFLFVGYRFTLLFEAYYTGLQLGNEPRGFSRDLFTTGSGGVFVRVTLVTYLFIPLVTMGVFAREFQSGSIKLLMSSPVQPLDMVVGKFLGLVFYFLFLMLALGLAVAVSLVAIPHFDVYGTLPGLLGIFLLFCVYAAIGMFISSLTQHQVVAAIITLGVLWILQFVDNWFQLVPVVNELTSWASLGGRTGVMREGLLSSPDIIYFVVMILVFLGFSTLRISLLRTGGSRLEITLKAVAIALVGAGIGWLASQPQVSVYIDTTFDRRNSLSPESVALMERLEGPWEIVTYANIVDRMGPTSYPRARLRDRERYGPYRQINHQLTMSYELYYEMEGARDGFSLPQDGRTTEEILTQFAERFGINPDTLSSGRELDANIELDLQQEGFKTVRVLRWNGKEAILRHFLDPNLFPDERTRGAAIKQVIDGPVNVAVAAGNGERSIVLGGGEHYQIRFTRRNDRFSLINHGFEFQELDLAAGVPDEIDILMIADPASSYLDADLRSVSEYIERGGDLVLLFEPESAEAIAPILDMLGVVSGRRVLQTSASDFPPEVLMSNAVSGPMLAYFGDRLMEFPVILDNAVSTDVQVNNFGFTASPMLTYNDKSMAYALERSVEGKNQRIAVFGDADVFSNANAERIQPINNSRTAFDTFHWLADGEFPVQRTRRAAIDKTIWFNGATVEVVRWGMFAGLPLAIIFAGGAC